MTFLIFILIIKMSLTIDDLEPLNHLYHIQCLTKSNKILNQIQ